MSPPELWLRRTFLTRCNTMSRKSRKKRAKSPDSRNTGTANNVPKTLNQREEAFPTGSITQIRFRQSDTPVTWSGRRMGSANARRACGRRGHSEETFAAPEPALHQRPTRLRRVPTVSWVLAACAQHVVVPDLFTTGRHICWMPVACHGRLVRPVGPTAVPRLRTPRSARRIPAAWPARAPTRTPARCGVRSARGTRH